MGASVLRLLLAWLHLLALLKQWRGHKAEPIYLPVDCRSSFASVARACATSR